MLPIFVQKAYFTSLFLLKMIRITCGHCSLLSGNVRLLILRRIIGQERTGPVKTLLAIKAGVFSVESIWPSWH